jgi:hypothetical protein
MRIGGYGGAFPEQPTDPGRSRQRRYAAGAVSHVPVQIEKGESPLKRSGRHVRHVMANLQNVIEAYRNNDLPQRFTTQVAG